MTTQSESLANGYLIINRLKKTRARYSDDH